VGAAGALARARAAGFPLDPCPGTRCSGHVAVTLSSRRRRSRRAAQDVLEEMEAEYGRERDALKAAVKELGLQVGRAGCVCVCVWVCVWVGGWGWGGGGGPG
jgi:hypothetical protein